MPKISVLMPIYNAEEKYLREAIESIINQTYNNYEFIIINDGSTNNVKEVISSYKDSRIIYVENEKNQGIAVALNLGINLAKGEYIVRMDSDDISYPLRFKRQLDFMEQNLNIGVLGTWYELIDKNEIVENPINNNEIVKKILFFGNSIGHPTVMIRKSIIDKFQVRYDKNHVPAEDYGLWLSLIDSVQFANLPEVLLAYRIHKNSTSVVYSDIQLNKANELRLEIQSKLWEINLDKEFKIIEKIRKNEVIDSNELVIYINYLKLLILKQNYDQSCINEIKHLYKQVVMLCPNLKVISKVLFNDTINKTLRISWWPRFKVLIYKFCKYLGFILSFENKILEKN